MSEEQIAIMESIIIDASDSYFRARPQLDTGKNRTVFEAGVERGYKAAIDTRVTDKGEQ